MEGERHDTHILSYSSVEEQNKIDKINTELKLSIQQESEDNNNIIPFQKIKIKDLFKNLDKREKNQIVEFEENEEGIVINEEEIKYMKNLKKKNNLRKNISNNLKDWIDKRKQMQEINTENFELIENKTDTKNINDESIKNEGTQTHNKFENGANEENNSKTSNIDSDQIGNPSNKETNEANKDSNLNENNEESDDNDLDNNKYKGKNKKYNESNFNFYLLHNQKEENKSENENNFNSSEESNYLKENDYDDKKTKRKGISIKKKSKNNSLNKNNSKNKSNYIKKVPNKLY